MPYKGTFEMTWCAIEEKSQAGYDGNPPILARAPVGLSYATEAIMNTRKKKKVP